MTSLFLINYAFLTENFSRSLWPGRDFYVNLQTKINQLMITYSKYIDSTVHNWYDSSNIRYSECYDRPGDTVDLEIVFGNGRVYRYRDVDKNDYLEMTSAESNGKAFAKVIRPKYSGEKQSEVDMDKLAQLRENFINEEQNIAEMKTADVKYKLLCDKESANFVLTLNNKPLYRGEEHKVSIVKLFQSMFINWQMEMVDSQVLANDTAEDVNTIAATLQTFNTAESKDNETSISE